MDNVQIQTDHRLLSLLNSGLCFLSYIDPEGLLDRAIPSMLQIDLEKMSWRLQLIYESGFEAAISGGIRDRMFFICAFEPINTKGSAIKLKPATSFMKALGDLSRVPGHMKPYLSREGLKTRKELISASGSPVPFLKNAQDALFYKIEDTEEGSAKLFRKWRFVYVLSEQGNTIRVGLSVFCKKNKSVIGISTDVDIYGIGNKKVTLTKTLGESHCVTVDCIRKEKERNLPSVKLAFAIDAMLKNPWTTERVDNKKIEKPKAKT